MSDLIGKGMYLWKIKNAEGGDPEKIAQTAHDAGLTHVMPKILNGPWPYNQRTWYDAGGILRWADDLLGPLVDALHKWGILVWGWQYVFLDDPVLEAKKAVERVTKLNLDGFVVDAEDHAKNKPNQTGLYLAGLSKMPSHIPVALSSYRYPSLHRELAWTQWLAAVDLVMPQVYWMQATNAGQQLKMTVAEYAKISDRPLPMIPTGAAFWEHGWTAKPAETLDFLQTAKALGLAGCNFWEWYFARIIPGSWDAIAQFQYTESPPPPGEIPVADFVKNHVYPGMVEKWQYTGPKPI